MKKKRSKSVLKLYRAAELVSYYRVLGQVTRKIEKSLNIFLDSCYVNPKTLSSTDASPGVHPMKKTLLFLLTAAIGVSLCAPAQTVTSVNAVGMVKRTVKANGLTFVGINFEQSGTPTVDAVIGNQLTGGTSTSASDNIIAWDPSTLSYKTFWKVSGTGNPAFDGKWFIANTLTPANITLEPGKGFWVLSRRMTPQEITLSGEVPSAPIVVDLVSGLSQIGFPYPVTMTLNDPANGIAAAANGGTSTSASDNIILWDVDSQTYTTYWKVQGTGNPSFDGKWFLANTLTLSNASIEPGQGFWFHKKGLTNASWEPPKPYLWP